ncbi:unnamed protein product, partial [Polarella glacialis]
VSMWRARARFMLHLDETSAGVKLDNWNRLDACEICGKGRAEGKALVVSSIYTSVHLASLYREQRDMSPLWNTELWKHFYKTFTPTCTLCEACAKYYHARNNNIPVNEKRFQRLQVKKKSAWELTRRSEYPLVPLDPDIVEVLNLWLAWTRCFVNNEAPVNFLPRFGIDGRTGAEIRRLAIMSQAEDDGDSLPSLSDDEEPDVDKEEEETKKKSTVRTKDPLQIDLDAEDIRRKPALR